MIYINKMNRTSLRNKSVLVERGKLYYNIKHK